MSHAHESAAATEADRRTVRRVAAVGAAAIAATALATAGVASGAGSSAGGTAPVAYDRPMTVATTSPATASPSATTSPSATASSAPQLKIQIAYQRVGRELTLTFTFAGHVVEPLAEDGTALTFPTPATRDIGMGETLAWGDGNTADVPVTGRRCPTGPEPRTVHEVADTYSVTNTYAGPGTYTINYSYAACGLKDGKIAGSFDITIPK